ncbi:MerR family transcriptional regulator [Aestuariicella hydrocarbonica]|uniref:MerR family transcriptional regulator n=1 Tax=Pseudomaricurvus hydrocarbonicus TaxID=1470433 RepID=A0A9E5MNK6_9GAMM|nr:MerR family transcriptional regulator [Aestuariicella hydrocarbonica]NHO67492.1 MerR family transcriptional regulator [Aestuariicella hydrocarbonica]
MSSKGAKNELSGFPIRELSARTQVNTVTIRAWERRYGLLVPQRTDKGHRLYSEDDVATVEKILSLVARGVPLKRVKALLSQGASTDESVAKEGKPANETAALSDSSGSWAESVDALLAAVHACEYRHIEQLIDQSFLNYPSSVCRQQLMEPAFARLAQEESQAGYLLAESELVRYTLFRLNGKGTRKATPLTLVVGDNTPLWRLCLMAMELADASYPVQLLCRPFTLADSLALAGQLHAARVIFYQDGVWRGDEKQRLQAAASEQLNLLLCGTAGVLAGADSVVKVYPDLQDCLQFLLQRQ